MTRCEEPDARALRRWIVTFGSAASLLALAMCGLAVMGISQEYFEGVHPVAEYGRRLLERPTALRCLFAVDNLFLLSYTSFFVAYYTERRGKVSATWLKVMLGAVLGAAFLDAVENFHILSMMHRAELGAFPRESQIEFQYVVSAVKFTAGYFAALMLAITYPKESAIARLVAWSTGVCFPLVGVAVFAASGSAEVVLSLARLAFFVSGYALSTYVFGVASSHREDAAGLDAVG